MKSRIALAAALVLFVAGWFVFGPSQFGGPATYVTTFGISMEPTIHRGDLVIAHHTPNPKIGDVVAYHSNTLNVTVLHRIVDQTPEGFATKGDNNSWLDQDHPTAADIKGVEWLHIPQGGIWLRRAMSPQVIGALLFVLIFAGGATATHRRRHRSRRQTMGTTPHTNHASLDAMAARREQVLKFSVAGLALGGLLLVVGFTQPTHLTTTKPVETKSTTTFAYTATVPPTAAYQGTVVHSPDPVFRKLANIVDVTYDYVGEPGTVSAAAELGTSSGWRWNVPLAAATDAPDGKYTGAVKLDLNQLYALAEAGTKAAGVPMDTLSVDVVTTVDSHAGQQTPTLAMTLDKDSLQVSSKSGGSSGSGSSTSGTTNTDPMVATVTNTHDDTVVVENALKIMGWSIGIDLMRKLGLALLAVGALGFLLYTRLPKGDERDQNVTANRHHGMIVTVTSVAEHHGAVIDVASVDELVKIAKRYALLVLHWTDGLVDVYFVEDENTMYRCVVDHYDGHAHQQGTPAWPGAAPTLATHDPYGAPAPQGQNSNDPTLGATPGRGGARHAGSARTGAAGGGHGAARHTST